MDTQQGKKKKYPIADKLIESLSINNPPPAYRVYKKYAQKVVGEIKNHEQTEKPFFPQILCKALIIAIPKGFGLKTFYTWGKIRGWAYDLDKRANQQKNSKRANRMRAAADIAINAATIFDCSPCDSSVIKWHWCPLCWRPVLNSNGKKKCEFHKTGTSGYQRVNRLLTKIKKSKYEGLSIEQIQKNKKTDHDRLPVDQKLKIKKMVSMAFDWRFPDGWELLSFSKNYILKQKPDTALRDINACIEVLAPEAVNLFKEDSGYSKNLKINRIGYIKMNQRALLTRAETWLMLKAINDKRGGYRGNAGRPPLKEK